MNTIEIDDELMTHLKNNADPFNDTPNSVLRRLLGLNEESSLRSPKTKTGDAISSAEFVKKIIKHRYGYDDKPRKVGRYLYMFNINGKLIYFQNYSKPTNNLWYRLKHSAIEKLKNEGSEIILTHSVGGLYYPIDVSILQEKLKKKKWDQEDVEVNINPDDDYWRELDWRLDRHTI